MKLLKTIKSSFNPSRIYGRAGDEVKIINDEYDKQAIVEDVNGKRFSTLKENLTKDFVPDTTKPFANNNQKVQVSKERNISKVVPLNQQSLFQ